MKFLKHLKDLNLQFDELVIGNKGSLSATLVDLSIIVSAEKFYTIFQFSYSTIYKQLLAVKHENTSIVRICIVLRYISSRV